MDTTKWRTSKVVPDVPLWRQIADQLATAILSERIEPGDKLPSQHELADLFRVSRDPVKKAMHTLVRDGLVRTVPGGGSYAATPPARQISPADAVADRLADAYNEAKSGPTAAARDHALVRAEAIAECLAIITGQDHTWWLNRCETLHQVGEALTGPTLLAEHYQMSPDHGPDQPMAEERTSRQACP